LRLKRRLLLRLRCQPCVHEGLFLRGPLVRKPLFFVCYRLLLVPPISATRVDIEVGI